MTHTEQSDIEAMAAIARIRQRRREAEGYRLAWNDEYIATEYLEEELARLRAENERLWEALKRHHQWHLDSGDIVFDMGGGETMTLNNAAEYSDSSMCEQTLQALNQKGVGDA